MNEPLYERATSDYSLTTSGPWLDNLDLRSWSPGFSRSYPPEGGTPTEDSTVDESLATIWSSADLTYPG
jgi:hypothetical protein